MTDKKSTIWQEELRKHLDNATPTEDWSKLVKQDDRIIQFDAGEEVKYINHEIEPTDFVKPTPREEVELLEGNMGEGKAEAVKAFAKAEGITMFDNDVASPDVLRAIEKHEELHEQAKPKYNVAKDMHINAKIVDAMDKEEKMKATKLIMERATGNPEKAKALIQSINLPDLDEESKRSDRFFGMRLKGKSIDDIENTFLAMFAEFIVLMALFIGMLGFGVLLWAIFG